MYIKQKQSKTKPKVVYEEVIKLFSGCFKQWEAEGKMDMGKEDLEIKPHSTLNHLKYLRAEIT